MYTIVTVYGCRIQRLGMTPRVFRAKASERVSIRTPSVLSREYNGLPHEFGSECKTAFKIAATVLQKVQIHSIQLRLSPGTCSPLKKSAKTIPKGSRRFAWSQYFILHMSNYYHYVAPALGLLLKSLD